MWRIVTRLASSKEDTRGRGGEARGVRVERVLGVWQSERSTVGEERAYVLIPRSLCECAVHECAVPLAQSRLLNQTALKRR